MSSGRWNEITPVMLIRAAIDRCVYYEDQMRKINADPTCSKADCEAAASRYHHSEEEFGWQWRNVRTLLDGIDKAAEMLKEVVGD